MNLFTYDELDRTLFEYIRKRIVEIGYLPDVTLYANATLYDAAKVSLRNAKPQKQLIDIFGVGSADDRDELTSNKITINRTTENSGNLGGGGFEYIDLGNNSGFTKQYIPESSTDITYEIRLNAINTYHERIMSDALNKVFGKTRFLKVVNPDGTINPNKAFEIVFLNKIDTSAMSFLMKTITLRTAGVFLSADSNIIDAPIVPLNTIEFGLYLRKEPLDLLHMPPSADTKIESAA